MHIGMTGSTGMIGSALTAQLEGQGHIVTGVTRSVAGPGQIRWGPQQGQLDPESLKGMDAVVHLAGEPIGSGRWTSARKRRIRDSRAKGTHLIAETMARVEEGPRTLVCASGVHYYGDRGDTVLTTDSGPGEGYLAGVVRDWEAAADPARQAGIRVVHVRTGIVQSVTGGALPRQLPLFKVGLGGRLGSGRQYWSWVTLDDTVGIYERVLVDEGISGPVNATAPNPVTNAEYTRVLAGVLGRPALFPVPRFGPQLVLGKQMADELLFSSLRVLPERMLAAGYEFRHPTLEQGLRQVLGKAAV